MMVQPAHVLVAALLITLSYCSAENVYCVTPTDTSCSSCPHNNNCATLSEYAQEAELYFTSNTTMVFLPGDHVLDTNITVANVTRLTMCGESSSGNIATVVCSVSVGFRFTSMVDFKIDSLAFTSCSRQSVTTSTLALNVVCAALFLQSTQYAELVNCSFHDNPATALVVNNSSITLAGNNFTHNRAIGIFGVGSAVTAHTNSLTFTGNTTFHENIDNKLGESDGGAIFTSDNSVLNFSGINNFINNSAKGGGAMFTSDNTVVNFSGTNNFINNSAKGGGAIDTSDNTVVNFSGINNFINNSAKSGGAIATVHNTVVNFSGINNFINNSADDGGAIYTFHNTVVNFSGINNFINNSAKGGGAIATVHNTVVNFSGINNFINNSATGGGAIATVHNTVVNFNGINNFINNSGVNAGRGGAIYATHNNVLSFNGTSNFINNFADYFGGAIFMYHNTTLTINGTTNFINNSADGGGAIGTSRNTVVKFSGTTSFINNSADNDGGAIYTEQNAVLNFSGTNNFINNSVINDAGSGGAIYAVNHNVFNFSGTSNFVNNSAAGGGAIYTIINNALTFNGTVYFNNNGYYGGEIHTLNEYTGGGVYMGIKSTFSILPHTTVYWEKNYATHGGAIYVQDATPTSYCTRVSSHLPKEECFFQLPGQNLSTSADVRLVFKDNSADDAGSVLYGGAIDNCKLTYGLDSHSSGEVFDMIVHNNDTDYNTTSKISSEPFFTCKIPDCSYMYHVPHTVYPGETFQVSVTSFGQRNGTVSSGVISKIDHSANPGDNLPDSQRLQQAKSTCTNLNYTLFSLSQTVKIKVHAEGSPCASFGGMYILNIFVKLNQTCPPGFNISKSNKSCVCEQRLAQYTHQCSITNGLEQITRNSHQQFWVGYDNQSDGLILHPLCPFDYCVSHKVVITHNNTDIQCAYNRSGLLCGHCKEGYSLVLGASQCKQCTNKHLVLLIPFAVMGVALVFLLLVCKLTVATGTLSGLVFYANIVGVNQTILLPVESTAGLSVFVAWLNLDLGIEACFYNGMDAYSKTWLQFVFPIYIWVLVGLMIFVSNFSRRFAKLLGNNPVSVLATLILLSYTKILRTLIAVFYLTYLEYPTYNRMVWLYEANIDYLSGKHIPLFIVAVLVFLFLFLPYTFLLLFGQWLQAISHLRLFSWVNSARLKPFIDSYHAPYKAKHRYWPGLLLMLRFVLLLVVALNPQQDPSVDLLVILVTSAFLVAWAWVSGGVYRNWCLDALECSFALNLIILVGATYHVKFSQRNQLAVGYTSVSLALATFIGILVFQLANAFGITRYLKMKYTALTEAIRNQAEADITSPPGSLPDRLINPEEYEPPHSTPHGHITSEPTEGPQKRLTPVYTYGSIN